MKKNIFLLLFMGFIAGEGLTWESEVAEAVNGSVTVYAGAEGFVARSGLAGGGSGSIVDNEGRIITNCHVMGWGKTRSAYIRMDGGDILPAKLLFNNCKIDIAIIQILPNEEEPEKEYPFVPMANSDEVVRAQRVFAVGNPGDQSYQSFSSENTIFKDFLLKNTVTSGIVRDRILSPQLVQRMLGGVAIGGTQGVWDYGLELSETFDVDATINGGNSGGPLFNALGEQVGVNFAGSSFFEGQNMAIVINDAKKTYQDTVDFGRVVYSWLGIYVFLDRQQIEWSSVMSIQQNSPLSGVVGGPRGREAYSSMTLREDEVRSIVETPFEVLDIFPDSPASKAGFRRGDLIHAFGWDRDGDGEIAKDEVVAPEHAFEARAWIRALPLDTDLLVEVERAGVHYLIPMEIAEQPGPGEFAGGTL